MALETKKYKGLDPRAVGVDGREAVLTEQNVASVAVWLGAQLKHWGKVGKKTKLTISTPKGERVAYPGDTIVKLGTRRNGNVPTFFVIKQ